MPLGWNPEKGYHTVEEDPESAAPPAKNAAPPSRDAAPPAREAAPPARDVAPPAPDAASPAREAAPPARAAAASGQDAAPPTQAVAPPAPEAAPPGQAAAPPNQEAAPPGQAAAPPEEDGPPPPYTPPMEFPPFLPPPPPPFPTWPADRPDLGFPFGAFPVLGGFQPQPLGPPPAPAPAPGPAPSNAAQGAAMAGLAPGFTYLFPAKSTCVHVIQDSVVPYDTPNASFAFSIFRFPCNMKVSELIHELGARNGPDNKNGLTECVELGDGVWGKGMSIFKNQDGAKKTLADVGWDEQRGISLRAVWLVVHKGS